MCTGCLKLRSGNKYVKLSQVYPSATKDSLRSNVLLEHFLW